MSFLSAHGVRIGSKRASSRRENRHRARLPKGGGVWVRAVALPACFCERAHRRGRGGTQRKKYIVWRSGSVPYSIFFLCVPPRPLQWRSVAAIQKPQISL